MTARTLDLNHRKNVGGVKRFMLDKRKRQEFGIYNGIFFKIFGNFYMHSLIDFPPVFPLFCFY